MDFATITTRLDSFLKGSGRQGGTISGYAAIEADDTARDELVSKLKKTYGDQTKNMVTGKMFSDTAKTHKNLAIDTAGDLQKITSQASELETKVHTRQADLAKSAKRTSILQILCITILACVAVYSMAGTTPYVHGVALGVLLVGFVLAITLQNDTG